VTADAVNCQSSVEDELGRPTIDVDRGWIETRTVTGSTDLGWLQETASLAGSRGNRQSAMNIRTEAVNGPHNVASCAIWR
jgi:hypothetical protein